MLDTGGMATVSPCWRDLCWGVGMASCMGGRGAVNLAPHPGDMHVVAWGDMLVPSLRKGQ